LERWVVPARPVDDVSRKRVGERLGRARKRVEVQVLKPMELRGGFGNQKLTLDVPTHGRQNGG
jgi:hypothetical protein